MRNCNYIPLQHLNCVKFDIVYHKYLNLCWRLWKSLTHCTSWYETKRYIYQIHLIKIYEKIFSKHFYIWKVLSKIRIDCSTTKILLFSVLLGLAESTNMLSQMLTNLLKNNLLNVKLSVIWDSKLFF